MSNNALTDPTDDESLISSVSMAPDLEVDVGPIQHGDAHTIAYDAVTRYWVFETELYIEYYGLWIVCKQ